MVSRALICLVLLVLLSPSSAQVLYTLASPNEEHHGFFGRSVAGTGDADDDGVPDVIVGAENESPGASPDSAGRAYVFSGATGDTLFSLKSPFEQAYGSFGECVSWAGDVNNDGHDDVIVGAPSETHDYWQDGRAHIFSGATGAILFSVVSPNPPEWTYHFGHAVASLGDVNSDGYHDVAVSSPSEFQAAGRVYVFSGGSGEVLFTLVSPHEQFDGYFGWSIGNAGDVNGDTVSDLVVGADYESSESGPDEAGRAYVFDGATGGCLFSLASPNEEESGEFGGSVSGAGDVNGDGYDDIVVGAFKEDPGTSPINAGRAYVFSGATGEVLFSLSSPSEEGMGCFGWSVSGVGDVDADGCVDIAVGAPNEAPGGSPVYSGHVHVFSGATGSLLSSLRSPYEETWGGFGWSVSGAGDIEDDGHADVIVGAIREDPGESPVSAGRAYVFGGFLIPVEMSMFTAEAAADGVLLWWQTESELSCFGFHLSRQREGEPERAKITTQIIPGGGTTSIPRDYSYLDPVVDAGTYRYWLEEVSEDGMVTEHGPVEAFVRPQTLALVGPHPNPVRDETSLVPAVPAGIIGTATLTLHDVSGRQVGGPIVLGVQPQGSITWRPDPRLAPGVYRWRLEVGGEVVQRTMVLMR